MMSRLDNYLWESAKTRRIKALFKNVVEIAKDLGLPMNNLPVNLICMIFSKSK